MRDYAELVTRLKQSDDNCNAECCECSGECLSSGCNIFSEAADAIEELLAVCREIAAFVMHYSDEGEVSAEVLCRKLHKIGLIEKDGAWWTLPAPPKEDAE